MASIVRSWRPALIIQARIPVACEDSRYMGQAQGPQTAAMAARGTNMPDFQAIFRRGLTIFLAIGGAFGAIFSLTLLATAIAGSSTPSSVLLVGFGFILLILSVLALSFAIWKLTRIRPRRDS